jgi:hypothetical protein
MDETAQNAQKEPDAQGAQEPRDAQESRAGQDDRYFDPRDPGDLRAFQEWARVRTPLARRLGADDPVAVVPDVGPGPPNGEPGVPAALLASLLSLPGALPFITGPGRVFVVLRFEGTRPRGMNVQAADTFRLDGDSDEFVRSARRIRATYAVGRVVPVVIVRGEPEPFIGISVAPVPGAPASPFCARCGTVDPPASHAC